MLKRRGLKLAGQRLSASGEIISGSAWEDRLLGSLQGDGKGPRALGILLAGRLFVWA